MTEKKERDQKRKRHTRLLKSNQFDCVFNSPSLRISNKFILLLARETELPYARLGLVVAKKKIPLAINRNRFKRLAREYFRKNQRQLGSLDIIVLSRGDITTLPKNQQNQCIDQIFFSLKKSSHAK